MLSAAETMAETGWITKAEAILKGEVPDGTVVTVDEGDGKLALQVA